MAVRNESLRLPFALNFYFSLGVDRVFLVDNGSTDNTVEIARSYKKTHVFSTNERLSCQPFWIDLLLRRYGQGHWCLVIDADELFVFPHYECLSLRELCEALENESANALDCMLLDMYPDKPLSQIRYQPGSDPLLAAQWFDKAPYSSGASGPRYIPEQLIIYEGGSRFFGGMRKRVFGVNACLSKFPLIKYQKQMFLSWGAHFIQNARSSQIRGVLLHFKYLDDFEEKVREEVQRKQHWENSKEYREYLLGLNAAPHKEFKAEQSVRFAGSRQLVELNLMKSSPDLDSLANARTTKYAES